MSDSDFTEPASVIALATNHPSEIDSIYPHRTSQNWLIPLISQVPKASEIKPNVFYEPQVLPDHRGDFFQLQNWKLHQQEIYNLDGNLIPPWQWYSALRPGTMVLAMATIHCYNFIGGTGSRKVSSLSFLLPLFSHLYKIYQLKATKIKVLASSDAPIEERPIPSLPHLDSNPNDVDLNESSGNLAFVTFELPTLPGHSNEKPASTSKPSQPASIPPLANDAKTSNSTATPSDQLPISDIDFMLVDLPTSEAKSTSASPVLVEPSTKRNKGKGMSAHSHRGGTPHHLPMLSSQPSLVIVKHRQS